MGDALKNRALAVAASAMLTFCAAAAGGLALWFALAPEVGFVWASAIVAGIFLVIAAAILAVAFSRQKPAPQPRESEKKQSARLALETARAAIRENPAAAMALSAGVGYLAANNPDAIDRLLRKYA